MRLFSWVVALAGELTIAAALLAGWKPDRREGKSGAAIAAVGGAGQDSSWLSRYCRTEWKRRESFADVRKRQNRRMSGLPGVPPSLNEPPEQTFGVSRGWRGLFYFPARVVEHSSYPAGPRRNSCKSRLRATGPLPRDDHAGTALPVHCSAQHLCQERCLSKGLRANLTRV